MGLLSATRGHCSPGSNQICLINNKNILEASSLQVCFMLLHTVIEAHLQLACLAKSLVRRLRGMK